MSIDPSARQHLAVALGDVSTALNRLGYRVKEIENMGAPEQPPDLKFSTLLGKVEVVYCTSRRIEKRAELEYEVAGAITAYCALFYTLNPPPGV